MKERTPFQRNVYAYIPRDRLLGDEARCSKRIYLKEYEIFGIEIFGIYISTEYIFHTQARARATPETREAARAPLKRIDQRIPLC